MDFINRALTDLGGDLQLWKVAIKPGRPFVFGRFPSSNQVPSAANSNTSTSEKLMFGLPGNPVSAFVTFLLLVRPAILRWQGASNISLPSHPAILAESLANSGERRHFTRVRIASGGKAYSAGFQASH